MKWNVSLGNEKNMMDQVKKCAIYGKDHKGTYLERSDKKQQLLMLVLFDVYIRKLSKEEMINLNRKELFFEKSDFIII